MNRVTRIERTACDQWVEQSGRISHRTGRYFDLIGVRHRDGDAVMIDQPEVGILAFLVHRERSGSGQVLVNNKAEPGNVGTIQLSPTVQATRSNIDRVHGGRSTHLLHEVMAVDGRVADALGSEQGDRFYSKVNRNLIRVVTEPVEPRSPQLVWTPLTDLRAALRQDFRVNTDARSVLVSAPWGAIADDPSRPLTGLDGLFGLRPGVADESFRTVRPDALADAERHLVSGPVMKPADIVPLRDLIGITVTDEAIIDEGGRSIVGWFDCELDGRETRRWCQPLLESHHEPEFVLTLTDREDVLRVALRRGRGPGWTHAEFGPTRVVIDTTEVMDEERTRRISVRQSDEGGRFHRSIARYSVEVVHDPGVVRGPVVWLSLGEVEALARRGRRLTNELRSCLSLLLAGD